MQARRTMQVATAVTVALALGACGAAAEGTRSSRVPARTGAGSSAPVPAAFATPGSASASARCGAQAPETLSTTAGMVARRIYEGELTGSETRSDQRQVESYRPLLNAVASGSRAAISSAVTSLVYA